MTFCPSIGSPKGKSSPNIHNITGVSKAYKKIGFISEIPKMFLQLKFYETSLDE